MACRHRGTPWYAAHFDPAAAVRGEASPGYTSPCHAQVVVRMAAVIPDAHLVYVVRDPVGRAVSQYCHHRREGSEKRDLADALLDSGSQYVARGRYAERLAPFLDGSFPITIVAREELARERRKPRSGPSSGSSAWTPRPSRPLSSTDG